MEQVTKIFNVYDFDELQEGIKEKLIKKQEENELDFYCDVCLLEDMEYKGRELIKEYFGEKATFKQVCYSLGYCQGDGAMIEFDLIYYNKNLQIRNRGNYCHELSFEIIEQDNYLTEKQEKQLKEKIYKMNIELKNYGYDLIEQDFSEIAIENLRENKYFASGEIFNF